MKHSSFKVGFPIGAVFFGMLVGPSMVSGIFSKVYFVPYGMWGYIFAMLYPLVVGSIIGFSAELARRNQAYDYNSFCHALYGKASPICTPIMEVYMLMNQIVSLAAVATMGGSMCNTLFGWPNMAGCLVLGLICLVLVLWGAELIRKLSSWLCVVLIIGFIVLTLLVIKVKADTFVSMINSWYVPATADLGYGFWKACLFAFCGAGNGMVLCAVMQKVKTKKDSLVTGLCTIILVAFILLVEVSLILPYMPGIMESEIPTLYIINKFLIRSMPWLPAVYYIIMVLALVTSGVPTNQAMIARVEKIIPKKGILQYEKVVKALIGIVFLAIVLLVSTLGLTTIVNKGYSFLGYIAMPLIVFPTFVLLPLKWHRDKKSRLIEKQ